VSYLVAFNCALPGRPTNQMHEYSSDRHNKLLQCILISIIGISFVVQKAQAQTETIQVLLKASGVARSTLIS
jgi:hypothetical protein